MSTSSNKFGVGVENETGSSGKKKEAMEDRWVKKTVWGEVCIVHVRSHDGQNRACSVVCATKCYACHASASRMSPTATQVRSDTTKSYVWHSVVCDNVYVCVTMLCGTELCACVSQFGVSQRSRGGGGGGDGVQKAKNTKPTQCRELYHYLYHCHSHYQSLSHVNQRAKRTQLTKSCDIYDAIHTDLATLVKSIPVLRRLPRRSLFVPNSPLWLFDIEDPAFVEAVRFQWWHPDYPTWYGADTTIEPIFHQAAVLRLTVHHFTITRELSATICLPGCAKPRGSQDSLSSSWKFHRENRLSCKSFLHPTQWKIAGNYPIFCVIRGWLQFRSGLLINPLLAGEMIHDQCWCPNGDQFEL